MQDFNEHEVVNVVLTRLTEPRFFAGALHSGRPVWVHKHEHARPVPADQERLGELLLPIWPIA